MMSVPETSRIELQSFDWFKRIESIHSHPPASLENLQDKYIKLYKVLEQACYELTAETTLAFANLFSRLDYICKAKKMTPSDRYAIQTMRRNCKAALQGNYQADLSEYRYDLRAIAQFVSASFDTPIPSSLLAEIPASNRPYRESRQTHLPYLRASVTSWDDTHIFAATDDDESPFIIINYAKGGYNGDLLYLKYILTENMPINLLDVRIDDERQYIPGLVIVHPDYLIDISSLAVCFREYGRHPLNYFINKLKPRANTAPILLGNLASQFLDDYINEREDAPVSYPNTVKKFFASSALEFCTCQLPDNFHAQAQTQMSNIRSFVHEVFPRNIRTFDKHNILLEASFICERLGLQGRTDMLQKDFNVLVEQKSGKRDEYNHHSHKEDHFVQMMLYQGVLMYNFGCNPENIQTFLLYSKYSDGLMMEHFAENLFRESICLRNRIVANEMAFAKGSIESVIKNIDTETLNEFHSGGRLWNDFQKPELQKIINTLKGGTELERAYFQRFFTFISKESVLSKTGGRNDPANGFAGTWHIPLHEKIEAGNILLGLTILDKRKSSPDKGYDLIELNIPQQGEDFLPNFRTGDIVIFYAYDGEPDVRQQILLKGSIVEIQPDRLTLLLRNGQQNKDIIGANGETFAVEHDTSDVSTSGSIRGLYAFLNAQQERKALLLCQRAPSRTPERRLNGSYGRFDELILKEKQADDYFLLVGPPGTGKTSCALRYMVEEALTDPAVSILLLSYTNRAVDEICSMLVDSGIALQTPFIRIGHEFSCDKRYLPYLLKNSLKDCPKLTDIRRKINQTRIFVGTTTALNSRSYLFNLKRFQLAIIDEASQILEPDLIGILAARHEQTNAIGKFILVGDYKQLPAVALQQAEEASVTDPLLQSIGLDDCRNSLFERLYKQSGEAFRSVLRKQGRMHPAISEFPNNAFYYNERLEPVPLPHQEEIYPYPDTHTPHDDIDRLLLTRRMVFIPAEAPDDTALSDKTNLNEARIVSVLLQRIYRLTEKYFDAHKTVGVIVPYRNQIAMIRKEVARLGIPALNDISIDTVERYQGSQRDVIIYSFTVRNLSQLNFLTANSFQEGRFTIDRKLNVAITRARKQLLLTGNPNILGANLTFYKLMEYIRLNNGYVDATASDFCRASFSLPEYEDGWDTQSEVYPVPEHFQRTFRETVPPPAPEPHASQLEAIAYGRSDFRTAGGEDTAAYVHLYNYYYMCKQYAAARSLYEVFGNRLRELLRNTSGHIVFCDFAYESGASGLAFADVCRNLPHTGLTYLGVCPEKCLQETADTFFRTDEYRRTKTFFYAHPDEVPSGLWPNHAARSELIVLNFSNLFDRISIGEACSLAQWVNHLVKAYPYNRYVTFYRDDSGQRANPHAYMAFCNRLTREMKPLNEQMPYCERFYYKKNNPQTPDFEEFLYEIRTYHE